MDSRIAVIVLTRTPSLFERLVSSLGERPCNLGIVVNNGQSPEVTEFAVREGWACVNPRTNLSFSEGNNVAAKVAISQGCSHVLLLNDDVIASPEFLEGVRSCAHLAEPVLGFRITDRGTVNHDGTCIGCSGSWLGVSEHIGRGDPIAEITDPFDALAIVPSVTFAAALVRLDAWADLGGLDEGYLYGWEDTDFCLRVISDGGIVRVCRDYSIEHAECGTRARNGSNDRLNVERFLTRWQPKIPALFDEYGRRFPDAEGLGMKEVEDAN